MPQFDVYRNLNPATRQVIPYLLDLQAELLSPLATRVIAPLVLASEIGHPIQHLNLQFEIEGILVIMSTAELAGISRRAL